MLSNIVISDTLRFCNVLMNTLGIPMHLINETRQGLYYVGDVYSNQNKRYQVQIHVKNGETSVKLSQCGARTVCRNHFVVSTKENETALMQKAQEILQSIYRILND